MPRSVSGSYTLPGAVNPVVSNDLITANWANTTLNDVATSLTNSLDRTGNGAMLAQLKLLDTGGAGAPPLAFAGDLDTGLYPVAANQLGVSLGGTLAATFASTAFTLPNAVVPTWAGTPSSGSHLTNKTYTDATFLQTSSAGMKGTWALLNETAVTAVTNIDFIHGTGGVLLDETYDYYFFEFANIPVVSETIVMLGSSNSGSTWGTNYLYNSVRLASDGTAWVAGTSGSAAATMILCPAMSAAGSAAVWSGLLGLNGNAVTGNNTKNYQWEIWGTFNSQRVGIVKGSGQMGFATAVNALRFRWGSGAWTAGGFIRLYGRRK
jgi:hypothetical protein